MLTATAVAAIALVATVVVTPLAIAVLRRRGVVDRPNSRSSHSMPTVRGAGVGMALVASVVVMAGGTQVGGWVAVPAALLGGVGFVDDLRGLPVSVRLPVQVAVAVVVSVGLVLSSDIGLYWYVLGPLWIVGYLNAFNFMDGINGISAVHASVVGIAWTVASTLVDERAGVVLGLVLAAVTLGFLPYNFPVARAFIGDVGSYFLGAWIAVGAVILSSRIGLVPALLPTAVYVADTGWTLIKRLRHGQRWSEPHRDHLYQRLVRGGWSHRKATGLVGAVTAATGALAVWPAVQNGLRVQAGAVVAAVVVCAGYLAVPHLVFEAAPGVER